jgi:proteic killer suppression protein
LYIEFRKNILRKQFENSAEAIKAYGEQVGRKYIERINILKRANNINELSQMHALRCHPLHGTRAGEWAINLTGYYRLIFTLEGKNLQVVRIEEVSKHYE